MQARFKPKLKASKEEKAREKISRKELEEAVGRKLEDDEVRRLKKARREVRRLSLYIWHILRCQVSTSSLTLFLPPRLICA